jgi:hypothetical protein
MEAQSHSLLETLVQKAEGRELIVPDDDQSGLNPFNPFKGSNVSIHSNLRGETADITTESSILFIVAV